MIHETIMWIYSCLLVSLIFMVICCKSPVFYFRDRYCIKFMNFWLWNVWSKSFDIKKRINSIGSVDRFIYFLFVCMSKNIQRRGFFQYFLFQTNDLQKHKKKLKDQIVIAASDYWGKLILIYTILSFSSSN